jgi:hypothetical protein
VTIVKVQLPLAVAGRMPPGFTPGAMIYREGRRDLTEQPLPEAAMTALAGDAKGYFEAERDANGFWILGKRVEEQPW